MPAFQRNSMSRISFKGKKYLQNRLGRRSSLDALNRWQADVFHPTYFDSYFYEAIQKKGIPFVLTVHDMIHEIYGHGSTGFFSLDAQVVENKRFLAEKAQAIVAVSENTKKDLLHFYPALDPNKIKVIHHGNSMKPIENWSENGTNSLKNNFPYLLFVGQRKAYKNFHWMLEQIAGLLQAEPALQLICVGGSTFDAQELARFEHHGLQQKIHYRSITSDLELAALYQQASCFIFPSQYEGFGIPVLEAFACGCPCVLNHKSALPEVGGDAALYFDENQADSLENAIRRILEDSALRNNLRDLGLKRVQQFTWQASAVKHLELYQTVVK